MPFTVVIESYWEFAKRHGNRPLACGHNTMLFADGAACSADNGDFRQEPPTNPVALLRRQLTYWKEASRRSTADFEALRGECARQSELAARYSNLPGVPHQAIADLRKLKDAVGFCRAQVSKLEEELAAKAADDPDHLRRQALAEYEREQQAAAAALIAEIQSIVI